MKKEFLVPRPQAIRRPVSHEANNGVNCFTCRQSAREMGRLLCTDFSTPFSEPVTPSHGCKNWKARALGAPEPVVFVPKNARKADPDDVPDAGAPDA